MTTPTPRRDFIDRVMMTVEADPRPSATRSFARALHDRSRDDATASLAVAWRLAAHARAVPVVIRIQALALVAVVALASGAAVTVAAGAAYQVAAPIVRSVAAERMDVRSVPTAAPAPAATVEPLSATVDHAPRDSGPDRRSEYDDAARAPMPPLRGVGASDGLDHDDGEADERDEDEDAAPADGRDDHHDEDAAADPDDVDDADEGAAADDDAEGAEDADGSESDEHTDEDDEAPGETDEPDASDDGPGDDGEAEPTDEPDGDD